MPNLSKIFHFKQFFYQNFESYIKNLYICTSNDNTFSITSFLILRTTIQMETKQKIIQVSMTDTVSNCMVALPLVATFEVYLIINWIVNFTDRTRPGTMGYLYSYLFLLLMTVATYAYLLQARKKVEKCWKTLNIIQHHYCVLMLIWALVFTYIGSECRGRFDYLVYVTIVTVVPFFTYLHPILWLALQAGSASFMLYLASHHEHFHSFAINFIIFTIISMAAGWSLYRIRRSAYTRQIELEQERNRAHTLAFTDTLTGMPNRHSCNDQIEAFKKQKLPADLMVAIFDVNSLKYTNDVYGHDVGDILIQGATQCMRQTFAKVGTIYRVGGDEFTGFLHCTQEQFHQLHMEFELLTRHWSDEQGVTLSVSIGNASVKDNPNDRLATLITKADNAMYDAKQHYYELHPKG